KGNKPYTSESNDYILKNERSVTHSDTFPSFFKKLHHFSLLGADFGMLFPAVAAFPFKAKSSALIYQSTSAPRNVAFATVSATGFMISTGHADKILDQNWSGGKQCSPMRIN